MSFEFFASFSRCLILARFARHFSSLSFLLEVVAPGVCAEAVVVVALAAAEVDVGVVLTDAAGIWACLGCAVRVTSGAPRGPPGLPTP